MKYFVLSDPHGFTDIMKNALERASFDKTNPNHCLIVCGDVFDRGNQPCEMVDFLNSISNLIFIRGNHEELFFDALEEYYTYGAILSYHHKHNKTDKTIYQLFNANKLNAAIELINKSIPYYEVGNYIFTHSCLPNNYKEASNREWASAAWGNPFLQPIIEGKTIVFGHWHTGWAKTHIQMQKINEYDGSVGIYKDVGLIGLDTCTVITQDINVLVLDI